MQSSPIGKSSASSPCGSCIINHSHTSRWTLFLFLITGFIRPPSWPTIHIAVLNNEVLPSMDKNLGNYINKSKDEITRKESQFSVSAINCRSNQAGKDLNNMRRNNNIIFTSKRCPLDHLKIPHSNVYHLYQTGSFYQTHLGSDPLHNL